MKSTFAWMVVLFLAHQSAFAAIKTGYYGTSSYEGGILISNTGSPGVFLVTNNQVNGINGFINTMTYGRFKSVRIECTESGHCYNTIGSESGPVLVAMEKDHVKYNGEVFTFTGTEEPSPSVFYAEDDVNASKLYASEDELYGMASEQAISDVSAKVQALCDQFHETCEPQPQLSTFRQGGLCYGTACVSYPTSTVVGTEAVYFYGTKYAVRPVTSDSK
jgi:hypothetical protein